MNVKWVTLFFLTCFCLNVLHISQLCEEYFRYEVTANVRIGFPEYVEFPSVTLCVDVVDTLKWQEMSSDLIRNLTTISNLGISEKVISKAITEPKKIRSQIQNASHPLASAQPFIYENLVKQKTVAEIFNLTEPFEEVFPYVATTGLLETSQDSTEWDPLHLRSTKATDFPFTVDMIFIHFFKKCFTLKLRPGFKKVSFQELLTVDYSRPYKIMSLISDFGSAVQVHIHNKGDLIHYQMEPVYVYPNSVEKSVFVTHESNLLEYPYKSNCRNYIKSGFLSKSHCQRMCFKRVTSKLINATNFLSYAFSNDKVALEELIPLPVNPQTLMQQCNKECLQNDCRSFTYLVDNLDSPVETPQTECEKFMKNLTNCQVNFSVHNIGVLKQVFTGIQTQAAIPLISFLTGLLSTFGFWLGLSVYDSRHFTRKLGTIAKKAKQEIACRQKFGIENPIGTHHLSQSIQQQIALVRKSITRLSVMLRLRTKSTSKLNVKTRNRIHPTSRPRQHNSMIR